MNEGSNKSGIQHEGTETPSGSAYEGGEQVDRRVQAWEKLVADSETRIERINSEIDRMFASLSTEQRILTRRKRKLQEALNDARV